MREHSKDQPSDSTALHPLPVLPVLRGAWCDQATTDAAISFLEKNKSELLLELLAEENGPRLSSYLNIAYEALEEVEAGGAALPATGLGKIDLIYELSRRLRRAYGLVDVPPLGTPFAAGPDKPLPPLVRLAVSEGAARRGDVTQEMADHALQVTYERRPDLWYALAEEYRLQMRLFAVDEFRALLQKVLDEEYGPRKNNWTDGELFMEAVRRIYKMCGIEE